MDRLQLCHSTLISGRLPTRFRQRKAPQPPSRKICATLTRLLNFHHIRAEHHHLETVHTNFRATFPSHITTSGSSQPGAETIALHSNDTRRILENYSRTTNCLPNLYSKRSRCTKQKLRRNRRRRELIGINFTILSICIIVILRL